MNTVSPGLPKPGEVIHVDYRPINIDSGTASDDAAPQQPATAANPQPMKLLQWNIERGYQLDLIIQQLREVDADVISLQEVDVGCDRSGCKDTGASIAQALGLNYLFICEFEELRSELRDARSQGGGVHGNAIMTKFDIIKWDVIEHSHHPIDWNADPEQQQHPLAAKEPRRGRRLTLAADINTPQGHLRVYCCHLEVFCGISSRVWQFSDILKDAKQQQCKQQQQQVMTARHATTLQESEPEQHKHQQSQHLQAQQQQMQERSEPDLHVSSLAPLQDHQLQLQDSATAVQCSKNPVGRISCQAILGDLNTMAHGVARLSPNYCCDGMRWRTLGMSEAEWWQKHVFAVMEPCAVNKYLLQLGLPQQVAEAAVNPGFFDPFDAAKDITLDNPAYRLGPLHLMAGKLDWTLLKGVKVVSKQIGNSSYAASDHRWLLVEVLLLHKQ